MRHMISNKGDKAWSRKELAGLFYTGAIRSKEKQQVKELRQKLLGNEHPGTRKARFGEQEKYQESEEPHQLETLEIHQRTSGSE
ncbi:hypothetical protein V8E54_005593 [Elaphomyces granulatus]